MQITIRPIATYAEYLACEQLQRLVWGSDFTVPLNMLVTVQRNGGLVLGAFAGNELVGFVFGFLARTADGRLKHASHMAAVRPDLRDLRIGERLKRAQREFVRSQDLELITWTFDPLLARNAHLNIHKLGAICRTYMRNVYGPEPELIDGILPSDRFQVEWWIVQSPVDRPPTKHVATAPLINPSLDAPPAIGHEPTARLRIPLDFSAIQQHDPGAAQAWRYHFRACAEAAFAAGYVVVDFGRIDTTFGAYVLVKPGSQT
jgi:predicted GNAT superfamily acetyltransferase